MRTPVLSQSERDLLMEVCMRLRQLCLSLRARKAPEALTVRYARQGAAAAKQVFHRGQIGWSQFDEFLR